MAGAFLALGSCMSALTRNQVIAFVLTITLCILFVLLGMPPVLKFFYVWLSTDMTDLVAYLSIMTHFQALSRGVLDLRDLLFFIGFIAIWLLASKIIIDLKKPN